MARISTYANDEIVSDADRLLGSNGDGSGNGTINYTVGDLKEHILGTNSVFEGIVPPDRYPIVGSDGFPIQGQLFELPVGETDVAIPANFVFNLARDGEGFVIELRRFGQLATPFAYDINSIVGSTWVSTEYPTAGEQTISAFLDPRFSSDSDGDNQTWRFRTTISNPLSVDSTAGTVGRALTAVVVSGLTSRSLVAASQIRFTGLPTATTGVTGNLYTRTGTQLGITGAGASLKFVIQD